MAIWRKVAVCAVIGAGAMVWLSAPPVAAQDVESLRSQYRIEITEAVDAALRRQHVLPAISTYSPTAFGANWRDVIVGAVAVNRQRTYYPDRDAFDNVDGAAGVGFGLGNAYRNVGVEVVVISYSTARSGILSRGGVSIKAHRAIDQHLGIAVGVLNAAAWGDDAQDASFYGVVTKNWTVRGQPLVRAVTVNLGVGNGNFRRIERNPVVVSSTDTPNQYRGDVGVFGGVSLHVRRSVTVIADWTGQDLNLGLSLVPFRSIPLIMSPVLLDVAGTSKIAESSLAPDLHSGGVRFMLTAAMAFRP